MRGRDFFGWIFREGRRFQADENNLTEFLIREYKKAERDEFYNLDSFFTPLKNIVSGTKPRISENYEKTKIWYKNQIERAKKGELNFRTEYYSSGIYQEVGIDDYFKRRNQEVHKQFCEEFKTLTIYDIISHRGGYKLDYVEFFERGLEKAIKELSTTQKQSDSEIFKHEETNNIQNNIEYHPLTKALSEHGFFEIPKVKVHSHPMTLVKLMIQAPQRYGLRRENEKAIPYKMAMIHHLEFDSHILNAHAASSRQKTFKIIAKIFDANERTVRGHLNAFNPKSSDRKSYKAFELTDVVANDYKVK